MNRWDRWRCRCGLHKWLKGWSWSADLGANLHWTACQRCEMVCYTDVIFGLDTPLFAPQKVFRKGKR